MKEKKKSGESKTNVYFAVAAFCCFLSALVFIVFFRLGQLDSVSNWFEKYADTILSYEAFIQEKGAVLSTVVLILLNYVLKSVIMWFPISVMMLISGAVFPWYYAILINATGLIILFSIKFFYGKKYGGGNAEKILLKYDKAHTFIDQGKLGSTAVLFVLRLIPCFPINAVSQLYGATSISYPQFLIFSFLGFLYKLFSYTIIGRNIYNPFSSAFVVPLIILFLLSGFVLLTLSGFLSLPLIFTNKTKENEKL